MQLGIDLSNYSGDVTEESLTFIKNSQNIKFAIVACQFPAIFYAQASAVLSAGLGLEAYIYMYNQGPPWEDQISRAVEISSQYNSQRLWFDVEDEEDGILPTSEQLQTLNNAVDSKNGVYTREDYWLRIGNPQMGSKTPLWVAKYDGDIFSGFAVNFGGWLRAHTKQFSAAFDSYGVHMGLDSRE